MARGSKIKKIEGIRKTSYQARVDIGTDPATGKRKQKTLTADTKQELEKLIAQTLADVSRNVYFEPQKMTMAEYLDYWLRNYKANVEATTFEDYKSTINLHLKPAFGGIPITKLTPAHVQGFITNQVESGLAPNTIAKQYTLISQVLKQAVKWEIIPRNVCDSVDKPKVPRIEAEVLTAKKTDTIIKALKGTYHEAITHVIAYTGGRIGEVLALKREDINIDDGYLIISHSLKNLDGGIIYDGVPKGKKPRRIDLEPETIAVLKARYKEIAKEKLAAGPAYQDKGYIFAKPDGTPYSPASFSGCWTDIVLGRTGIKAHPHMLRHGAATMMLENGVPIHEVSKMLGHASVAITGDVYGHVTPAGRKEAARKLAEALANGRQ